MSHQEITPLVVNYEGLRRMKRYKPMNKLEGRRKLCSKWLEALSSSMNAMPKLFCSPNLSDDLSASVCCFRRGEKATNEGQARKITKTLRVFWTFHLFSCSFVHFVNIFFL